jgi:squalene-hopene/tetraprenyl-beta-curcumene cyclase
MVDRFAGSDGLGAIFPPMIWSVIALRCLGYDDASPELQYCYERLQGLVIEEETTARLQPCKSPVWDTASALRALHDAGLSASHPAMEAAVDWLLDNEVSSRRGDWAETVDCNPGGWCFEYANQFYPDLDDTAMVAMALQTQFEVAPSDPPDSLPAKLGVFRSEVPNGRDRTARARGHGDSPEVARLDHIVGATARAEKWMLAMQNRDGGWGAFDRDNDREFLCYVPFADHNAMIDPSTPDLAARVLEALA